MGQVSEGNQTLMDRERQLGQFIKTMLRMAESEKFFGEKVLRMTFRDGVLHGGWVMEQKQTFKFSE